MVVVHVADQDFGRHARPGLTRLLRAFGLDVVFHRAAGDHLYTRSLGDRDQETAVLDLVGGFGAGLFGHHHPQLVETLCETVRRGTAFNAQGSVRAQSGALAARLATMVRESTGRDYFVTFGCTGADAVEASMKHAVADRNRRLDRIAGELGDAARRARRDGVDTVSFAADGPSVGQLLRDAEAAVARVRATAPVFVSLSGAFHGKTTGAAVLTESTDLCGDFRLTGPRHRRITDWDDPELPAALDDERTVIPAVRFDHLGQPQPATIAVSTVAACYVEPIQGEGGVTEVPAAVLQGLRTLADRHGAVLAFDEIQCGMGRSGTFLASTPSAVRADHYLLAKALGGGLVKISAVLVDRERYVDDVDRRHTATFADDDVSAAVALAALDLLDDTVLAAVGARGVRLRRALESVARDWPDVFGEIRGRGLMIGIDLHPVQSASGALRDVLGADALGYAVSGYLLHRHQVRVLPTLSAPCTLRVEPSLLFGDTAQQRLLDALTDIAGLLRGQDVATLLGHLGTPPVGPWPEPRRPRRAIARRGPAPRQSGRARVAFLANLEGPHTLRSIAPELASWSEDQCRAVLDRFLGEAAPFEVSSHVVASPAGGEVELTVIGVPFTAAQAHEKMRQGRREWLRHLVLEAVALGIDRGAEVIGLGGYTSIVTDSARDVVEDEVRITSGNALTAACAVDAVLQWKRLGRPATRIGVVGALGNIGAVVTELLAEHAEAITLVGRPGSVRRLHRNAERLRATGTETLVSEDLSALSDCDVVIAASNAPEPVVLPAHLRSHGSVLVYDIAVPGDVADVVTARPQVRHRTGARMNLPLGQQVRIPGADLPPGLVHACLAESLVLGFQPDLVSTSLGTLTTQGVRAIRHHAAAHGFVLTDAPDESEDQMERSA